MTTHHTTAARSFAQSYAPQSGLQPAKPVSAVSQKPEKNYGSLTDKILDAAKLAVENDDLRQIKLIPDIDGKFVLQFPVKPKSWSSSPADILQELNVALQNCVKERIAKNEKAMRNILGGTRSRSR